MKTMRCLLVVALALVGCRQTEDDGSPSPESCTMPIEDPTRLTVFPDRALLALDPTTESGLRLHYDPARFATPGERIVEHAARTRVRAALAALRKMGLAKVIVSTPAGWMLDPAMPLIRVKEDQAR